MSQENASNKLTCNHFPLYQIQRQRRAPAHSATYSLPACPLSAGNPPASPALESWTWCLERSVWLCPLSEDKHTPELQKRWWLFHIFLQYAKNSVSAPFVTAVFLSTWVGLEELYRPGQQLNQQRVDHLNTLRE